MRSWEGGRVTTGVFMARSTEFSHDSGLGSIHSDIS
jgi:hypothetical protein